ncbi:MAG: lipid-A-disaccharide synthase N-terminal domain-containing protein [Phycisphaerales bacterium]|nr:lipid-A-disaccharide synthase N-terminal domain-containing protein [Phycisphaerales bacterium]
MKPGPLLAMLALLFLGMWLVLQPSLRREKYDFVVQVGSVELKVDELDDGRFRFVTPESLALRGEMNGAEFAEALRSQWSQWLARPAFERTMMGFFNISDWTNFAWVAVGLGGQCAFFARMLVQWVVSEKSRKSQVPEAFWWFSLLGGICLFTYFVWRVDMVGVLGQSTGIVIYARNLRLIWKERRRSARTERSVRA